MMPTPAARDVLFDAGSQRLIEFGRRDLLSLVCKFWPVLAACTVLVGAVAIYGASRQPQLYTATAQLLVKMDQGAASPLSGVAAYRESTGQEPPSRRIETEMTLLRSRTNIENVIDRYHLSADMFAPSPIQAALAPIIDYLSPQVAKLRALLPASHGGQKPAATDISTTDASATDASAADASATDARAAAYAAFNAALAVEVMRSKAADTTSNLIEVKLTGRDRVLVKTALASLMSEYAVRDMSQNAIVVRQAMIIVKAQAEDALIELNRTEQAFVDYSTGPAANSLAGQQIRGPNVVPSSGVLSPTAKLRGDLQELQTRLDSMRETYTDDYSGVRVLRDSIDKLRERMLSETREMVRTGVNIDVLDRRRLQAQNRYVELQRKLDQIELYLKLSPSVLENSVNTEAPREAEKASRLGITMTMALGPLAGLMLGVLIAAMLEITDRRLQSDDAVRRQLGLDVLAVVPVLVRAKPLRGVAA